MTTPGFATATARRRYAELSALAERDGGWRCYYCGVDLVDEADPTHVRVVSGRSDCPGGHGGVYPCDRGCADQTYVVAEGGRQWAQRDHVLPRSRGGSDNLVNLVLACGPCNNRKGALTPGEWKAKAS